jgi:hypothetical protein
MAAITSTIVALAGLGLAAGQAVKANKEMKKASSQQNEAVNNLKQVTEVNKFKGVQTPTLGFELTQQAQDQQTQQGIAALQGVGAEGVIGGIGQLASANNQAYLDLAGQANKAQFTRDMAEAEAGQGIESRRAQREYNIGANEVKSAALRRSQAETNRNQSINSAFSALGTAVGGADKLVGLYGNKKSDNNGATGYEEGSDDLNWT